MEFSTYIPLNLTLIKEAILPAHVQRGRCKQLRWKSSQHLPHITALGYQESNSDWLPGNYKHITKLVPCRGSWICLKGLFLSTQVMLIKWQWLFYSLWFPTAGMRDWFCKYLQKTIWTNTQRDHINYLVLLLYRKRGEKGWETESDFLEIAKGQDAEYVLLVLLVLFMFLCPRKQWSGALSRVEFILAQLL